MGADDCNTMVTEVTETLTISLEIKCPQLSKPEATAVRNQNSIGDRNGEKNLGRNQAQSGPVLLWPDEPAVKFQPHLVPVGLCQSGAQMALGTGGHDQM